MQVEFKKMYSCKLVEDLEKERQRVFQGVKSVMTPGLYAVTSDPSFSSEMDEYSKQFFITKYCQMGVNRRWHDYFKEVRKNHLLDEQGRYEEMTMPEMMSDKSSWSEEDHKVYGALLAAKEERLNR